MRLRKISVALLIAIVLINIVLAPKTFAVKEIIDSGKGFLDASNDEEMPVNEEGVKKTSDKIYNVLLLCGIGVAVIVGAVLGITFILSSAEGKAKVSETLVPYIIGCFIVFGAFSIWRIAINMGNNIENDTKETTEDVFNKNARISEKIENGEIDLMTIPEEELRSIYNSSGLYESLKENIEGKRNKNKITLEEAVQKLAGNEKKIWEACNKRGLLQDDGFTWNEYTGGGGNFSF